MTALLTLCEAGDEIVSSSALYGGTYSQFAVNFAKLGIKTTFVDPDKPQDFRSAITPKTRLVYAETLGNPRINIPDISAIASIAHDAGLPLVIDNTMASPYLCRPFEHGADIVVHSATKYIGGHGTTMGGAVVESGKFPWDSGKFPGMTEPSKGYHGVRFYETFGDFGFTMKARMETLRTFGPRCHRSMPSFCCRGWKRCTCAWNAAAATRSPWRGSAEPSAGGMGELPRATGRSVSCPGAAISAKGCGAVLSFGIKGGMQAGTPNSSGGAIRRHLANIGDAETLIVHPASTTRRQMSEQEQSQAGVAPDVIRLRWASRRWTTLWEMNRQALTASAKG